MSGHASLVCLPAGGNSDGNFGLSLDGELKLYRDLDREETPVYSIIIKASSNKSWTPPRAQRAARTRALDPSLDPSLLEVRIELEDINDQTPRFTKMEYTAGELQSCVCVRARALLHVILLHYNMSFCLVSGVASNAKVGSELIKVVAIDNDVGNNSLVQYHIVTIRYFQSQNNGSEDMGNIFTIGESADIQGRAPQVCLLLLFHGRNSLPAISSGLRDGVIRTYDLFTAYSPGYFQLEILACDFAGHSTTSNVNIYILRDDQRVKIVFNEIPDLVRESQEEFIGLLSNITGAIVNMDDIQVRSCPGQIFFFFLPFPLVCRLCFAAVPRG